MVQATQKLYSSAEYLELEAVAECRREFRNGEIILMAGGTTNHNEIVTNISVCLKPELKAKNYRIFTENVRLRIERYNVFTYPDVMVIAGDPNYYGTGTTTVTNPTLIVEVASKSTKNYDQGEKFDYYRSLESFQEYILVEQFRWRVVQYTRTTPDQWLLTDYEQSGAVINLTSVGLQLPLSELYAGVDLGLPEE